MKHSLFALCLAGAITAQTSPPDMMTREGAGVRNDLFSTSTFRFQQIEEDFPVGTYRGVSFRRDRITYDNVSAQGRTYDLIVRMAAADHSSLRNQTRSAFNGNWVAGSDLVVFNARLSLPDIGARTLGGSQIRIPFSAPYRHTSPIGARTRDVILDIDGTSRSSLGPYPLDADFASINGVKKPDPPCIPANLGSAMTLDSLSNTSSGGYDWSILAAAGTGSPVALIVGTTSDGVVPPDPICKQPYSNGDIGIFPIGIGNSNNQVLMNYRLPNYVGWSRVNVFIEAITPDQTLPLGVALSEGVAQPFAANFGSVTTLSLCANDRNAVDAPVEVHSAAVLIFD